MPDPLDLFHPLVREWFSDRIGTPTDVQAKAWPLIAARKHVLVTAPTGSGKTLTAFLWGIDQLIRGRWAPGNVRMLYVSPLKALNNDIQRNLLTPLDQLRALFQQAGEPFPDIRVVTRSGDTPQSERQRMVRRPPEILITTPESLNILLSSRKGRDLFTGLQSVILDEIHAVAPTKRGTHLITAVERLVLLAGEFQRIAISATIKPLALVADFVGGYRLIETGGEPQYVKRAVTIIESGQDKAYQIQVRFPSTSPEEGEDREKDPRLKPFLQRQFLPRLAEECRHVIERHRSTLVFTNNRRHCEAISMLINKEAGEMLAYSHHGSLSREVRLVVEQRLKQGDLKAIVATSSLELGIDIGALDEVVLVGTPMSVSSAVQRVGRAGHQVGAPSHGLMFPMHGRDIVDAAVVARAVIDRDIESVMPITAPLDVLAQVLVSMAGVETWNLDKLYNFIRTAWPFRDLPRRPFDLVVDMLAGKYRETRLRALQPLVSVDRIDNTVAAGPSSLRLLYSSGGTIPDRGYFSLRRADTLAKIGELDEEFVWERRTGDSFTLGMHSWRIGRITHSDVFVEPLRSRTTNVPFWRAEELDRAFHVSDRIGRFLETAEAHLSRGAAGEKTLWNDLQDRYFLNDSAADALVGFLKLQRSATRAPLPHHRHVLIERTADTSGEGTRVIIHTLWGGRVNRPLALALSQAWERGAGRVREKIDVLSDNDCIVLLLPGEWTVGSSSRSTAPHVPDVFSLLDPGELESLLRERLEQTGFFGARFRENAARALLLPRQSFNRRMPLWLTRQRSKKLLDAVAGYEDFPILAETWRTCLQDEFDLPRLRQLLEEIRAGQISVTETATVEPSPFAGNMLWRITNILMYEDDTPAGARVSNLSDDLIKEAVFASELRPQLAPELVAVFEKKAQRLYEGYAPRSPEELLDWIRERLFIPESEWKLLLAAIDRDTSLKPAVARASVETKAVVARLSKSTRGVVAIENVPRFLRALGLHAAEADWAPLAAGPLPHLPARAGHADDDLAKADPLAGWLAEWLRFYGPVEKNFILSALALDEARLGEALETLLETRAIVADYLVAPGDRVQLCDAENLEILLRLSRARARAVFEPLPAADLPLFLARHQQLLGTPPGSCGGCPIFATGQESASKMGHPPQLPGGVPDVLELQQALEPLLGHPMPAALLETEVLPARIPNYTPATLDSVVAESDLMWFGAGHEKIALCFLHNRDLFAADTSKGDWMEAARRLFTDARGQYYFNVLLDQTRMSSAELASTLWDLVWEGKAGNDTFGALRKGIEADFKVREPGASVRRTGRLSHRRASAAQFSAWKSSRAYPGAWRMLPPPDPPADLIDLEELNKDRVRVLLMRYGVLFRELLARELPALRWGALFRALRLMELSGEIVAGNFFNGVPGIQFASHESVRALQQGLDHDAIYWLNAADPASLCGADIDSLKHGLPKRVPGSHLVYHGNRLVIVSKSYGKHLEIRVPPDHPRLTDYFGFMRAMLTRAFHPMHRISIEKINGGRVLYSPYLSWLRDSFEVSADPKTVWLWLR